MCGRTVVRRGGTDHLPPGRLEGIAREMRRDSRVVCLGEDIGAAEGSSRPRPDSLPSSVRSACGDTPISSRRSSVPRWVRQ